MKILHFDILEGFKKGSITQFENDNLNETYKIYLYKNKMRFDVDGKTIRFVMLDKNKAGQVLTLKKGEASNEIILPVTKELTKIDGVYDAQIIFTKEDGYNEKTIPFRVTIKNDLLTDMESELVSREEYQYLVDRFEEAVRNIENFKVEIRNEYSGLENDLNDKYNLFKDEVNNSNETFKNETNNSIVSFEEEINNSNESFKNTINFTVNSIDEKVNSFDSRISKNTKEIDDAKDEYDTLKARLDRENEKVYETINSKDFLPFEGENVTVEHSKVGFTKDMVIEGRTYQNLIENSNVKKTIGRSTETQAKYNTSYILKQNATYTVVFTIENKTDANPIQVSLNNGYTSKSISVINGINSITLSTDEQGVLSALWFYYTVSITNGTGEVGNILLLEGEPNYIPSYFEGIKSVGEKEGKISILSTGKNLFKGYNKPIPLKAGKTYYLSSSLTEGATRIYIKGINNGDITSPSFYWSDSIGMYSLGSDKQQLGNATNITVNKDCNAIFTATVGNTTVVQYDDIQLEQGTQITPYEQYRVDKKEILLPIKDGLKGLPNGVCDTIENREDGVYFVKRVGRIVLDGSENLNWSVSPSGNNTFLYSQAPLEGAIARSGVEAICDKFKYVDGLWQDTEVKNVEGFDIGGNNTLGIKLLSSKLSAQDVAGFKAWLKANPTTIYYELAEPIETKLDISSLNLETFKDITHILSENAIAPKFNFKAPVDVPATISGLRSANTMLMAQNSDLQAKNEQLEDVNKKQTKALKDLDDTTNFLIEDALSRKVNN